MAHDTPPYNIAAIRELLRSAFTSEELRRFCQDHPLFRPVLSDFGSNLVLNQMVDSLVSYCETQSLFSELLAEVKRVNPRQYARFEEQLQSSPIERGDIQPQIRGKGIQVGEIRAPGCSARNVVILLSLTLLMALALASLSIMLRPFGQPTPTVTAAPSETSKPVATTSPSVTLEQTPTTATAHIVHTYVDADNNLHVVIEGVCQPYRLYVRRLGQTFGDPPHYQYYRIYKDGACPKDLLVVVDVSPDMMYCAEIKSEDNLTTHDVTSYQTGAGSKPFVGEVYEDDNCPFD